MKGEPGLWFTAGMRPHDSGGRGAGCDKPRLWLNHFLQRLRLISYKNGACGLQGGCSTCFLLRNLSIMSAGYKFVVAKQTFPISCCFEEDGGESLVTGSGSTSFPRSESSPGAPRVGTSSLSSLALPCWGALNLNLLCCSFPVCKMGIIILGDDYG